MISFNEIMTRGMMFYDHEYLEECKTFCKIRGINYLPHISSASSCYFFNHNEERFIRKKIDRDQTVRIDDDIYSSYLINSFEKHEVLFVKSRNKVVGLVHFSDYNRAMVYEDLYKKLYLLERGLVFLITEYSELRKSDLLAFLEKESTLQDREQRLVPRDFRGENFSLRVILKFVQRFQLVRIRQSDIDKIISLRNKIAHSYDLISQRTGNPNLMDYKHGTFKHLMLGVNALEVALKQVGSRLYFMEATTKSDFSIPVLPLEEYLSR